MSLSNAVAPPEIAVFTKFKGLIGVPWFPMISKRDNNITGRDA